MFGKAPFKNIRCSVSSQNLSITIDLVVLNAVFRVTFSEKSLRKIERFKQHEQLR
jgi:hypothetical protein